MSKERNYLVYVITCLPTGLKYVGMTNDLSRRKSQHFNSAKTGAKSGTLYDAMRKYPRDQFLWEVDRDEMFEWEAKTHEIELIAHFDTFRGPGYNQTEGGDHGTGMSPEKAKEFGKFLRQYWKDNPDILARMGRSRSQFYKDNPQARKEMSKKIRALFTPEKRAAQSEKIKRIAANPMHRKKLKDSRNRYFKNHPESGKKHSEKMKRLYKERPEIWTGIGAMNKSRWDTNPETHPRSKPVLADGLPFAQQTIAAKYLECSVSSIANRIKWKWKGYRHLTIGEYHQMLFLYQKSPDTKAKAEAEAEARKARRIEIHHASKPVHFDGRDFLSRKEMKEHYGAADKTIKEWLNNGLTSPPETWKAQDKRRQSYRESRNMPWVYVVEIDDKKHEFHSQREIAKFMETSVSTVSTLVKERKIHRYLYEQSE